MIKTKLINTLINKEENYVREIYLGNAFKLCPIRYILTSEKMALREIKRRRFDRNEGSVMLYDIRPLFPKWWWFFHIQDFFPPTKNDTFLSYDQSFIFLIIKQRSINILCNGKDFM